MSRSARTAALSGYRIAVTRARSESATDPLVILLRERGALPLHRPLTEILPPQDPEPLQRAGRNLLDYDWVIVTSARGVAPLVGCIQAAGHSLSEVRARGPRFCAVGPATANALHEAGLRVDLIPDRFLAEGVLDALRTLPSVHGSRFLLPRAEAGRDVIPDGLGALGARVDVVPAYRSVARPDEARLLAREVWEGRVDALTFTAGSAARSFLTGWREYCSVKRRSTSVTGVLPQGLGVFALGPATAKVVEAEGFPVDGVAEPHTFEGLVDALESWALASGAGDANREKALDL
jgi:uroporphyrinogen-III synthase